jgi:lysophospholipase L1-like esterase
MSELKKLVLDGEEFDSFVDKTAREEIAEIKPETVAVSKNLFDKTSHIRDGVIPYYNGTLYKDAGVGMAAIPVKPNTQYVLYIGVKKSPDWMAIGAMGYSADGETLLGGVANIGGLQGAKVADGVTYVGSARTFTTPDGCNYLFAPLYFNATNYDAREALMVQEGDTFTGYEPYVCEVVGIGGNALADVKAREQIGVVGGEVKALSAEVEGFGERLDNAVASISIDTEVISKNLYDKETQIRDGVIPYYNGTLYKGAGVGMAAIPVKPNTQYLIYLGARIGWDMYTIGALGYSADGETLLDGTLNMSGLPLGKSEVANALESRTITTPDGCNYLFVPAYFNATNYEARETLMVQEGDTFTGYEEYIQEVVAVGGKNIADIKARERLTEVEKQVTALTGQKTHIDKNIVIMGDSITANPQWWVKYLQERIEFKSCTNLARSGATWRNHAGTVYDITTTGGSLSADNTIWNQYNKMKAKVDAGEIGTPDVVAIYAGTNDGWYYAGSFGTVEAAFADDRDIITAEANTILTTCDGVRYVVELIREEYPNCQVVLATPLQCDTGEIPYTRIVALRDLIKSCGARLGCAVVNQTDECGIYGYVESKEHRFLYDGVHTTNSGAYNGAELVGKFNAKRLAQLILV